MNSENWTEVRLGDLVSIKHGWPFKSTFFDEDLTGRPVVVNIGNFRYTGGFRFESTTVKEYGGEYPLEYELRPGDILLVMTCQTSGGEILGIPGRVPDDGRMYLHNQRIGRVIVDRPDVVDDHYLYWLFLSPAFNRELVTTATGSKILHTSPSRIEAFRFRLPSLPEQRRIAGTLDSLQDKIELNRRTNHTLESIARAIFKSWFVDFDPVRKKMEGGEVGLPPDLAALFPSALAGAIDMPAAWPLVPLGECAAASPDTVTVARMSNLVVGHYSLPAFDNGQTPEVVAGSSIKSPKYRVRRGQVLLSRLNPRIPRVWLPDTDEELLNLCSTEFIVLSPRAPMDTAFLYGLLGSDSFSADLASRVTGTSGSHQRVRPSETLSIPVVRPPEAVLRAYSDVAEPMRAMIGGLRRQARCLAALRDSMLPELLLGRLSERRRSEPQELVLGASQAVS